MITVPEASAIILSHSIETGVEEVSIQEACGRVLKEVVRADRDFPPFNRVSMDGVAIVFEAWQTGNRSFTIESIQAAGQHQKQLTNAFACIEVMTGPCYPSVPILWCLMKMC
ncbi:MAG: hypothetical protein HWD62_04750 [Cyclobacteriaceae bacterium]|nr:MAG: hypothetical protein HWD62_04750 [Cyclobacteriaceae bacterium]